MVFRNQPPRNPKEASAGEFSAPRTRFMGIVSLALQNVFVNDEEELSIDGSR